MIMGTRLPCHEFGNQVFGTDTRGHDYEYESEEKLIMSTSMETGTRSWVGLCGDQVMRTGTSIGQNGEQVSNELHPS